MVLIHLTRPVRAAQSLLAIVFILPALLLAACRPSTPPAAREAEAKRLFNETVKTFHLPSANASGPERTRLLDQAASGYEKIIGEYGDLAPWASQSLRSLANVRVEQGRLPEALKLYDDVARRYPSESWEILQAWKSAADLLWDSGQKNSSQEYYRKIIKEFDTPTKTAVIGIIVNQAKKRVQPEAKP